MKNVQLVGGDPLGTVVRHGRQLQWGFDPTTGQRVPIQAAIRNITFERFTFGAIRIQAAKGACEIRNCRFIDYRYGISVPGGVRGAYPIVGGAADNPELVTGSLKIAGCYFGAPDITSIPPDIGTTMNNGLHINDCALELDIIDNVIDDMHFVGIVVWGNQKHTTIAGNTISKMTSWSRPGFGIGFGIRPGAYFRAGNWDSGVTIERNRVTIGSSNSHGIVVLTYPAQQHGLDPAQILTSGIVVRGNVVEMNAAGGDTAALVCLGACAQSTWTRNVVTGSARYGLIVSDRLAGLESFVIPPAAAPADNLFEFNHLSGGTLPDPIDGQMRRFAPFEACGAQVLVGLGVERLELRDNRLGPVSGSNEEQWPPPLRGALRRNRLLRRRRDDRRRRLLRQRHRRMGGAARASPSRTSQAKGKGRVATSAASTWTS